MPFACSAIKSPPTAEYWDEAARRVHFSPKSEKWRGVKYTLLLITLLAALFGNLGGVDKDWAG